MNDAFRTTLDGGTVLVTRGITDCGLNFHREVIAQVRGYAGFDARDDPWGEHDFGVLAVHSKKVFFKIDYFDRDLAFVSPDATDPSVTSRVLTIMLAEEY
jgi:hypothetical protein